MKPSFYPALHAFRGFAIVNIVAVHAFGFLLYYAGMGTATPEPFVKALNHCNEVFLHGSTLYFTLISGLLFSLVLAKKGWRVFYYSKLSYVLLPYCFLSFLLTIRHVTVEGELIWFSGDLLEFIQLFAGYLLQGEAIFVFWYNGVRDFSRPNTIMGCGSRRSPRVNVTCHFGHSKSMI